MEIKRSAERIRRSGCSEQARIERENPYQKYLGQPRVSDLRELGFDVRVECTERRQLIAWRVL